jgi:hypothetical protein
MRGTFREERLLNLGNTKMIQKQQRVEDTENASVFFTPRQRRNRGRKLSERVKSLININSAVINMGEQESLIC